MGNVLTPEFRVSYPNVFTARKNDLNGKDEYSVVALFPKGADLSKLEAACKEVMEEKWGKDSSKWPRPLRSPFRKQDEKEKEIEGKMVMPAAHEKGAIFLNLRSQQRPGVVDHQVQDIIDQSQFYAGCWAKATVRPYAYDMKGNRGVAFGLQNIQKTKDGDPLSGRPTAQDDFAPIQGADSGKAASDLF